MILKWLAFSAELVLFIAFWLMDFGSAVLIVIGGLLALSGYLMGYGLGVLLVEHDEQRSVLNFRGWLSFGVGLAGTILLSWVRASGDLEFSAVAIVFPLVLASLISMFEAIERWSIARYSRLRNEMFRAQAWYSGKQHRMRAKDNLWSDIYSTEVKTLAGKLDDAFE
jgi:hypothetical protein